MRYLEDYFSNLQRQGKSVTELYEQVQSCGNVLPRLYLLITVGSVYIKSREASAKDILKDLVEMAKGVQHPMRGLFLRNYLSHVCRDKLPDVGSPYEGQGGTVLHSIDFILQNFAETNRLWVRMQNQGPTKDKKRREKERQELRILIGTNLVRLSHLEGVDIATYKDNVLPRVLEQVANCKDTIAQSYLMDCIIQVRLLFSVLPAPTPGERRRRSTKRTRTRRVACRSQVFPDEFHLATLEPFLETCTQLKEKVNVRAILESMMNRLSNFANGVPDMIPSDVRAFQASRDGRIRRLRGATTTSPESGLVVLSRADVQRVRDEASRRAKQPRAFRGLAVAERFARVRSDVLSGSLGLRESLPWYVRVSSLSTAETSALIYEWSPWRCAGMCVSVLSQHAVGSLEENSVEQVGPRLRMQHAPGTQSACSANPWLTANVAVPLLAPSTDREVAFCATGLAGSACA